MAQSAKQGAGLDCYQRNVQTRHLSAGVLSCLISWLFLFGILYKGWHGFFCQSTGIIQVCQQLLNGWINIHQKNHCTLDSAIGFPNTSLVQWIVDYTIPLLNNWSSTMIPSPLKVFSQRTAYSLSAVSWRLVLDNLLYFASLKNIYHMTV